MGRPRKTQQDGNTQPAVDAAEDGKEVVNDQLERKGLNDWEQRLWTEGFKVVAGTDEAGRGPLAGPVVAASFAIIDSSDTEVQELLATVNDSKQMTTEQRDVLFEQLTNPRLKGKVAWAIAEASVAEIDERNILRASLCAMARSSKALEVKCDCLLVDGCNRPPELLKPGDRWTRGSKKDAEADKGLQKITSFFKPTPAAAAVATTTKSSDFAVVKGEFVGGRLADEVSKNESNSKPRRVEAVIEGDGRVPSISAASILAKVYRDRTMDKLHSDFPVYGFDSHKGYGCEAHVEAIRTHGPCPHHRRSFGPIKEFLETGTISRKHMAIADDVPESQPLPKPQQPLDCEADAKVKGSTPPKKARAAVAATAKAAGSSGSKRGRPPKNKSNEQPPDKMGRRAGETTA